MLHQLASLRAVTEIIASRRCFAFQPEASSAPPLTSLDSIDLLGAASASKTMITGYWQKGFEINGVAVAGSQIVLPTVSFHWDVTSPSEITPDSLALFRILKSAPRLVGHSKQAASVRIDSAHPAEAVNQDQPINSEAVAEERVSSFELAQSLQIDLLIVGTGNQQHILSADVLEMCAELGISVESMSTSAAMGTFNCLNQEDRLVAVALLCNEPTSPRIDSFDPATFSPASFGL